jgi:hypothetical protein
MVLCEDTGLDCPAVRGFFEGGAGSATSRLGGRSSGFALTTASATDGFWVRKGTWAGTLANKERIDCVGATWERYRAQSRGGFLVPLWTREGIDIFSHMGQ